MDAASLFCLDGKVVLVTGASSGLGVRFAEVAAANGAKVVLVARRIDRLELVKARIVARGGQALAIPADVTDDAAMKTTLDTAERTFGTVDVFVANAGMVRRESSLEVTSDSWREVLDTNLDSVFRWSQEIARRLIAARKPGSIITVSSVGGLRVPVRLASYSVAKAALIQATKVLALNLGQYGIRVNSIAPGWIVTDLSQDFLRGANKDAVRDALPLRRFGEPGDLDGAFLLLASEAGRLMTGSIVVVDAGALLT